MGNLPGPKEALLNGIPLSEVQRREKRGQIIDYHAMRGDFASGRPAGQAAPPIGTSDKLLTKASPARGALTPMAQKRTAWGQLPAAPGVEPKGRRLLRTYRDTIDRTLAGMPWMRGSSLNIGIVLVLGAGVYLPVWFLFKIIALFFAAVPALSAVFSTFAIIAGLAAVGYFAVRKIRNSDSQ